MAAAWRKLLWEMNQPVDGVLTHHTIVIQDPYDLERLKTAIALKNTVLNKGGEPGTRFDNFLPGRMVSLQDLTSSWERTLEATVAPYFYFGELFHPAFAEAMEAMEMAKSLDGIVLPQQA